MNKSSCIIPLFHAGSGECLELDKIGGENVLIQEDFVGDVGDNVQILQVRFLANELWGRLF